MQTYGFIGNEQGSGRKGSSDGKIDDVGEVLTGARKDMRKEIAKSLANVTKAALVEKPFGKVYKKSDLKKAVESGALREQEIGMRDALVETMRGAGIEVSVDEKEGQRVLDIVNGENATLSKAQKRAAETASLNQTEGSPADISTADGAKVRIYLEMSKEVARKVLLMGRLTERIILQRL